MLANKFANTMRYNNEVLAEMSKGKSRKKAIAAVARKDPALHKMYLAEHNEAAGRTQAAAALRAQAGQ